MVGVADGLGGGAVKLGPAGAGAPAGPAPPLPPLRGATRSGAGAVEVRTGSKTLATIGLGCRLTWWTTAASGTPVVTAANTTTASFGARGTAAAGDVGVTLAAPALIFRASHASEAGSTAPTAARTETRARCTNCRTAPSLTPSSVAIAAGLIPSTAERRSALRWRSGSDATAPSVSRTAARCSTSSWPDRFSQPS